jgi:hypothetical protein
MENEVTKKPPCIALAYGPVSGAAWVDNRIIDNEVAEVHSIKFDRSYKDNGKWKHTDVFNTEDLLKLAMLATELYKRLRLRSYKGNQQNSDIPSNTEG